MFVPPFIPETQVGLKGPTEQYSLQCASNFMKVDPEPARQEDGDHNPLDDSASSLLPSSANPLPGSSHTTPSSPEDTPSDPTHSQLDQEAPPPSKFTDKLHTNYIPSLPEIAEIKQYVSIVDTKLAGYDTRIAELEATLDEMHCKRRQLHELNTAHRALSSPFRRLPPEIVQLIFVWCLPQTRNAVMHASEAPVLLGRVCSEWRRISLATPELWASLHIVPPNVNFSNPVASTAKFERKRDLVRMWLSRSGACPLSVSLVWFAGDSEEEERLCGTLLDVLVPLCGRWKSLDFQVPLKMFKPFVGLKVVDVPMLEGLSLMDNRTPSDMDSVSCWPESLNFAESASKLRTFTLTFFSGGIRLPSIPWSQLTTLYLESNIAFFFSDSNEMLSTLGSCSHLTSCTLKFPLSHTASVPAYEKLDVAVLLPELEALCLDGDQHLLNTFHMNNTLSNICTPKLRRLEILGRAGLPDGTNDTPEPFSALKMLFRKSRCPLEKLNLESMRMVPEEFVECLKLVPTLDELVVHNWTARVFTPTIAISAAAAAGGAGGVGGLVMTQQEAEDGHDVMDVVENQILMALTVSSSKDELVVDKKAKAKPKMQTDGAADSTSGSSLTVDPVGQQNSPPEPDTTNEKVENGDLLCNDTSLPLETINSTTPNTSSSGSSTTTTATTTPTTTPPLLPNLQNFDFTLCEASQRLLCNFIASRWDPANLPSGVQRLKSVKSNFSAFEEDEVKERMQRYKKEGLDVTVTFQVAISDDLNPSPWMGLEGPP